MRKINNKIVTIYMTIKCDDFNISLYYLKVRDTY